MILSRTLLPILFLATTLAAQDVQPKPTGRLRISGGVAQGSLLTKVNPVYPQEAKDAHVSGTVLLHAIIGRDGHIEDLNIISGPDMLRAAAYTAVNQWTYRPFLLNGEPTEVDTTITVNFNFGSPVPANGTPVQASNAVPPTPPTPSGPTRVSSGVMSAMVLSKPTPVRPLLARSQHLSGSVVMRALIGKDGKVKNLKVMSGPDLLQSAAVDSASQWIFRPFLLNGVPVEVDSTITITFND